MLLDRGAAEDAVQEAAVNAWRRRSRFREGADPRPWFFAIVANQCRSTRRTRWWSVVKGLEVEPSATSPEDALALRLDLRNALVQLKARDRALLVLHYHDGLTLDETARVLGLSTGAARVAQLSSGRVLRHLTYSSTPPSTPDDRPGPAGVSVSRDASVLAVMTGPFSPTGAGRTATIVRLPDGAVLARLDGRMVLAFSWDADLVAAAPSFGGVPSVVNWRTAAVLWTADAPYANTPLAEPNGTRLAVGTQAGDVWIVAPDGQATLAATRDGLPVS